MAWVAANYLLKVSNDGSSLTLHSADWENNTTKNVEYRTIRLIVHGTIMVQFAYWLYFFIDKI